MSDLIPCPSCKATLRVPSGAEAIRCPQCKHVVNLTTPQAPAAIPKAFPLPPKDLPKAVPLPFDQPKSPPPALPVARALPITKPVVRGRVVREVDEEPPEKPRSNRDSDKSRNPRLISECQYARVAVRCFSIACSLGGLQYLLFLFFMVRLLIVSDAATWIYFLTLMVSGVQAFVLMSGFASALAGPRRVRSLAAAGLIATMMQAGFTAIIALAALSFARNLTEAITNGTDAQMGLFMMFSSVNSLYGLSELPWMLLLGAFDGPVNAWHIVFILINSSLEFFRLSYLCSLTQFYAAEGKSPELGHQSLKLVYYMVWVVIISVFLKPLLLIAMLIFGGLFLYSKFFILMLSMFVAAYLLWWLFIWIQQAMVCREIVEVITPSRFADKRVNLDVA